MKKLFLSVLAVVGLACGFLCSSCSGGGNKEVGPSRALSGMSVKVWITTTPSLQMDFIGVNDANTSIVNYAAGDDNMSSGLFSILGTGKDQGKWVVHGEVNVDSSNILDYPDFCTALTGGTSYDIKSLRKFTMWFYFVDASATSGDVTISLEGEFGDDGGESTQFTQIYPIGARFNVINGSLKTEFLSEEEYGYPGYSGTGK